MLNLKDRIHCKGLMLNGKYVFKRECIFIIVNALEMVISVFVCQISTTVQCLIIININSFCIVFLYSMKGISIRRLRVVLEYHSGLGSCFTTNVKDLLTAHEFHSLKGDDDYYSKQHLRTLCWTACKSHQLNCR